MDVTFSRKLIQRFIVFEPHYANRVAGHYALPGHVITITQCQVVLDMALD